MADLAGLVTLARPRHWVKNVFVLMPLPASLASGASLDKLSFAAGLVGFSLVNSAVYAFNDANDAELDRQHAKKRNRPVASGRVSVTAARLFSLLLALGGVALVWSTGSRTAVTITVVYIAINVAYCLWARSVALLDVFLLSSGYLLRVLLGCALVAVTASNWLLLCTSTLALFLALAKRRSDVVAGIDDSLRPSLRGYNQAFLDQAIGITSGMTMVAYALYCMEAEVLIAGREFATLPFVAYGVFEYLRVVHVKNRGGSPVDLVLSDPTLVICGVGWVAAMVWSIGLL
jgi:4-hydroxybenzoate polyprenyltransferase